MYPLLAEFITSLFDAVSITDQVFEWRFKMLAKVDEVFCLSMYTTSLRYIDMAGVNLNSDKNSMSEAR